MELPCNILYPNAIFLNKIPDIGTVTLSLHEQTQNDFLYNTEGVLVQQIKRETNYCMQLGWRPMAMEGDRKSTGPIDDAAENEISTCLITLSTWSLFLHPC